MEKQVPKNQTIKTEHHVCLHHQKNPLDTDFSGCTCSSNYMLINDKKKETINETYDRLKLHKWWQDPLPDDSWLSKKEIEKEKEQKEILAIFFKKIKEYNTKQEWYRHIIQIKEKQVMVIDWDKCRWNWHIYNLEQI